MRLTDEQRRFCRKYGFDEATFALGAGQAPSGGAHEAQNAEDTLPDAVLNVALSADEKVFCADHGFDLAAFALGKYGQARYDAALQATRNGPAEILHALCGDDAPAAPGGMVSNVRGFICGPALPLV